ncbi:hypothetical protein BGZ58_005231 [Dissophora ornata]|nr:hypothetical protein BGZ58_005231 [Dissophora ornata]
MDVLRAFRSSRKDAAARDKQETGRPSPELPPEILYLVFKFVTQHTLRTAVRFVCKQWYSVARSMIHVHALWKDRKGGKYTRHFLLARLQQVTHLRVFFEQLSDLNNTRFAWKELEETVDLLRTTNRLHITKLTLNGALFMESRIYTILPKISTLTEIYFERIVQKTVHLGVILSVCRSLRRLYMELPEGYHEIADNTALPWKGTENGLRESGIVSLIIKGMRVEQDSLEAILARCPRLNVLKLIGLFYANSQVHPFNRPKFFETTAASCPHLECVHFSFQEHCLTSVDSLALIQTFFPGIATLSRSLSGFGRIDDSSTGPGPEIGGWDVSAVKVGKIGETDDPDEIANQAREEGFGMVGEESCGNSNYEVEGILAQQPTYNRVFYSKSKLFQP